MGTAAIIMLTAGFTAYTLMSPALGVILWVAGLLVAIAGVAGRIIERRGRPGRAGRRGRPGRAGRRGRCAPTARSGSAFRPRP